MISQKGFKNKIIHSHNKNLMKYVKSFKKSIQICLFLMKLFNLINNQKLICKIYFRDIKLKMMNNYFKILDLEMISVSIIPILFNFGNSLTSKKQETLNNKEQKTLNNQKTKKIFNQKIDLIFLLLLEETYSRFLFKISANQTQ